MTIIDIVENSRLFPWTYIDCGLRQGEKAILAHLQNQFDNFQEDEYYSVSKVLSSMQSEIEELTNSISPYQIPEDYRIFLEYYGGFAIDGINANFSVSGLGPMVETWYGYINHENDDLWASKKIGWLEIGDLVFQKSHKFYGQRVIFFLDLAGLIHNNCIIAIGPWNGVNPDVLLILEDMKAYSSTWRRIADSFSEWLALAIKTQGMFTYI
jgi:SMI1/KNR4 family protein SUKH-1